MKTLAKTLLVWTAFEALVEQGFVRTLGLSNCYELSTLRAVWDHAQVKPAVLQNRFYKDTGYDVSIRQFCDEVGITYQSFWTLTANPRVLESEPVVQAAKRLQWTPAQTFLRCLTQIGIVPLVGTTSPAHMAQDLAMFRAELSALEVQRVVALL
jgi:diketogulonate reductase-like aldo/keto reductase